MAKQSDLLATVKNLGSFLHTSSKLFGSVSQPFSPSRKLSFDEENEFAKLKSKLKRIRATLKDAEKLVISSDSDALWLRELKDLEMQAQDVVEEVEFKLQRVRKLEEFRSDLLGRSNKRKHEVSFCNFLPYSSSLSCKMRKLENQYEEIASDRKKLALTEVDAEKIPKPSSVNPTSSLPRPGKLHGRNEDVQKVTKMLLSDDDNDVNHEMKKNYAIIPIFGMSGVGKTSLVQHVCDAKGVKSKFGSPIWVHAYKQIDVQQLSCDIRNRILEKEESIKSILEKEESIKVKNKKQKGKKKKRRIEKGTPNQSSDSLGIELIQQEIKEYAKINKILLVLDDLWIENKEHWDFLMKPLEDGLHGSIVIVTTRNLKVAKMISHKICHLNCLSDDDCWSVCKQLVEEGDRLQLSHHLESIGRSIAVKCKGLPLAAKALGVILRYQVDDEHWNNISENNLWLDSDAYGQVLEVLKISYDYLPMPLKRCFAYCSLFPKDHIFRRDQMVELWMAGGFIDSYEPSPSREYLGGKYFDQLVAKCFFQLAPSHDITEVNYKMHDLYHELARRVSDKECSRTEGYELSCCSDHVRHSSLVPLKTHCDDTMSFSPFRGQDLRTFLFLGNMEYKSDGVPFSMQIPDWMFLNLLCLRVLDLSNTNIEELSDSVGNLIHLRYLGLENTIIKSLPETISYLFNLLVLTLSNCHHLVELPNGTKFLSKLRHLHLPVNSNILMPRGIGKLTRLQSLRIFNMGMDDSGCEIQELGNLDKLSGELSITGINHVTNVQSAKNAKLKNKNKLQKLTLQWSDAGLLASEVLEKLQPHNNLKAMVIKGFSGNKFASWLGDGYLSKLVTLVLIDCVNIDTLPSLGRLPHLKHLGIYSMPRLMRIDNEFCGSSENANNKGFPELKTLKFRKMDAWEEWGGISDNDFPCLEYLVLDRCPKLKVLPHINKLEHLRVHNCEQLQNLPDQPSPEFLDNRVKNLGKFKNLKDQELICF